MQNRGQKGMGIEFVCPSCGYKTLGAREPTNPAVLTPVPEKLLDPGPGPIVTKIEEVKSENTSQSISKSKKGKKISKASLPTSEWQNEIATIVRQIEELERELIKELQSVKMRLNELTKEIRNKEKE